MATIWGLARSLVRRGDSLRYVELRNAVASIEGDLALVEGTEAAARVVVCLHTSLPPGEWDKLSVSERLPYLRRAIQATKRQTVGRPAGRVTEQTKGITEALSDGEQPDDVARRFGVTTNYVHKIRRKLETEGK